MNALLVLATVLLVGLPADAQAKELEKLQGSWSVVAAEEGGKQEEIDAEFKTLTIVIKGDLFIFKFDGQPKMLDMKMKIDPSAEPKTIDLISTLKKGQVSFGIYELKENELKVIWSRNGKKRPDDFKTKPGDDRIFLTLKLKPSDK